MKRLLAMVCILFSLIFQSAVCECEPTLTLMVYLCGSDLETEAGAASADLAEMMAHYPADGSLRVIVMPSGSKAWQSDIPAEETSIYELTGSGLTKLCNLPLQSMGDPDTLAALLDFGYAQSPAGRHALILWDHGAGPNFGLCFDELFPSENSMDGLTLQELSTALQSSPAARNKLAWIGFDACLMSTLETACTVAPYAEYMIASQETEPSSGWNYDFLAYAASDASGAETGRRVIDGYFRSLSDSMAPLTLSCVSLRDIPAVSAELDQLFNNMHLSLDEHSYPDFAECRVLSKSPGYSTGYEYDLVDLADLLQLYQEEGLADCSSLLEQLDEAVVDSRSNMPYINGLSIYFPHYGAQETVSFPDYEGYAAFIADMSAIRLGKPLTDWSKTHLPETELDNGITHVTMALTPEQANTLDQAQLFIIKQMSGSDYQLVYRTNAVDLTPENVLTAAYEEQALFLTDSQGQIISNALPYSLQGDAVVLSCMLTRTSENALESDDWFAFVRCLFRQDEEGRYVLFEVQDANADPALQGKSTVRLEDYDYIGIWQGSSVPAYAEDGHLFPPAQWEAGTMIYGWEFALADHPDWGIAFLPQQDERSRYAFLQITDTQNHVVCSELVPIPNPNITDLPAEEQLLVDDAACSIRFIGAQEIQGNTPALRLHFSCENRDTQPILASVRTLQIDNSMLFDFSVTSSSAAPGEATAFEVEVRRDALESMGIQSAETIRMDLALSYNYVNDFLNTSVSFPLSADLSRIAPEPAQPAILDSATLHGLEFSLCDLACGDDRYATGTLRIRNTSSESVSVDASGFYINGLAFSGYLTDGLTGIVLQPGTVCQTGFRINLQGYLLDHYRPESVRFLPEALGMTHLKTLAFEIYTADRAQRARIAFTLPEALELPVDEALRTADTWPVLYRKDGVAIRLADITWMPDNEYMSQYRYLNLFAENSTDADVRLRIPLLPAEGSPYDFAVNGHLLGYVFPSPFPAQSAAMQPLFYTVDEGTEIPKDIEMQLCITDAGGRNDALRITIHALEEPRTDGSYCIMDARTLQVTVEPMN